MTTSSIPVVATATPDDADAVADLFLVTRRSCMAYVPQVHTAAETRWWIANVVLHEHDVHLLRDPGGGTLLGFAAVKEAWLEHLYVAPAEHGKGYGSQLLTYVIDRQQGELLLHVFQRNDRARRLYERYGFELVDTSDGSRNEEREPDATYRRVAATPC